MRCPKGDHELEYHSRTNRSGITISYHVCPKCFGHWLSAFDANYLEKVDTEEKFSQPFPSAIILHCPTCQKVLEKTKVDAIPPEVTVFHCPSAHGYFFPSGNLLKFKKAQEAKISYHKLWHIPLPPLRAVLLTSILIFLGISGVTILTKVNQTQTTESQAKDIISYQQVIVSSGDHTLLFLVRTNEKTTLTLHVDALDIIKPLTTNDGTSHTLLVTEKRFGIYAYYFEYEIHGKKIRSQTYKLAIP